eukprot:scaffold64749_cov28-Tisochrysis_lutea.AAC.9
MHPVRVIDEQQDRPSNLSSEAKAGLSGGGPSVGWGLDYLRRKTVPMRGMQCSGRRTDSGYCGRHPRRTCKRSCTRRTKSAWVASARSSGAIAIVLEDSGSSRGSTLLSNGSESRASASDNSAISETPRCRKPR